VEARDSVPTKQYRSNGIRYGPLHSQHTLRPTGIQPFDTNVSFEGFQFFFILELPCSATTAHEILDPVPMLQLRRVEVSVALKNSL